MKSICILSAAAAVLLVSSAANAVVPSNFESDTVGAAPGDPFISPVLTAESGVRDETTSPALGSPYKFLSVQGSNNRIASAQPSLSNALTTLSFEFVNNTIGSPFSAPLYFGYTNNNATGDISSSGNGGTLRIRLATNGTIINDRNNKAVLGSYAPRTA